MDLLPIKNLIYEIRGQKVMLDFDLAMMYGTETKRLKERVRRNMGRFPSDFMFELTKDEWEFLRCQFGTSNKNDNSLRSQIATLEKDGNSLRSQFATSKRGKHSKYLPFAFTEQGVAMLSSVLNSELAIETNIRIMRTFVAVRQMILNPSIDKTNELQYEVKELKQYIEEVFTDYNDINEDTRLQLEQINQTLAEMQTQNILQNKPRRRVGFYSEVQRRNNEDMIT